MNEYFNTTHLQGQKLKQAKSRAMTQNEIIAEFFRKNAGKSFTPCSVAAHLDMIITSVRRAIHNLTESGVLEKTEDMRDGVYGKSAHTWRLNTEN